MSVLSESFFEDEITPSEFPPIQSKSLDGIVFASSEYLPNAEMNGDEKAAEHDEENLDLKTKYEDAEPGVTPGYSRLTYVALGGAILASLLLFVRGFLRSRDNSRK